MCDGLEYWALVSIYIFGVLNVDDNFTYERYRIGTYQGRIFWKTWLPSFTQKLVVLQKTGKNRLVFGLKSGQKPMKEQSWHKTEARFGLSMPKNPYNNLSFDHIDGFKFFLILCVQIMSYLPLLQEGTTAGFPALSSSHNRPWNLSKLGTNFYLLEHCSRHHSIE